MLNFLHTYTPDPILLTIGPLTVRWYGLCIALGIVAALWIVTRIAQHYTISKDTIYQTAVPVIFWAIIGARLYYVLYAWEYYSTHLGDIIKIWEGGLAIHGALIGGILALFYIQKKYTLSALLYADILVVGVALGQAIGRWGNYFNQELFGTPTSLPLGIPIEAVHRPAAYLQYDYFHPTFLYESILNLCIVGILYYLHRRRNKKAGFFAGEGRIALVYIILYSLVRFGMEFLRTDYSPLVFGLRWAQVLSGILAGGGIVFLCYLAALDRRGALTLSQSNEERQTD